MDHLLTLLRGLQQEYDRYQANPSTVNLIGLHGTLAVVLREAEECASTSSK